MAPSNSGSPIGGGRAMSEGIGQTSQQRLPIVYQQNGDSLESRRQEFRKLLANAARYLYDYAATKAERSVCQEVIRGRALSIDGLEILVELAARAERPFTLEDVMRHAVLQRMAASPAEISTLHHVETIDQGLADPWQVRFDRETTPVIRDATVEHCLPHLHSLRAYIDRLMTWTPNGRRWA